MARGEWHPLDSGPEIRVQNGFLTFGDATPSSRSSEPATRASPLQLSVEIAEVFEG